MGQSKYKTALNVADLPISDYYRKTHLGLMAFLVLGNAPLRLGNLLPIHSRQNCMEQRGTIPTTVLSTLQVFLGVSLAFLIQSQMIDICSSHYPWPSERAV